MVGRNNSVLSRIRDVTDNQVFDLGCVSHMASLCAGAMVKALKQPVEDLMTDTYYYFHKSFSSERREEYKEFQIFTDVDMDEILKHVNTRWLSLERCIKRTLDQWPALYSYFNSQVEMEKSAKVKLCAERYGSAELKLYFYFLIFSIQRLNVFNTTFQAEGCRVLKLVQETETLLRGYLSNFVKAEVITASTDITKVQYKTPANQQADDELTIGRLAIGYVDTVLEDCGAPPVKKFYKVVRDGYMAVVDKILKKFPFKDPILASIPILDPRNRTNFSSRKVLALAEKFRKDSTDEELDQLLDQWQHFQVASDLPNFEPEHDQIDKWWGKTLLLKDAGSNLRFSHLRNIICCLLIMPYDQAPVERVFSMVRKNDTKFRPSLSNKTLCSVLGIEINSTHCCFDMPVPKSLLRGARAATTIYNNKQCSGPLHETTADENNN